MNGLIAAFYPGKNAVNRPVLINGVKLLFFNFPAGKLNHDAGSGTIAEDAHSVVISEELVQRLVSSLGIAGTSARTDICDSVSNLGNSLAFDFHIKDCTAFGEIPKVYAITLTQ